MLCEKCKVIENKASKRFCEKFTSDMYRGTIADDMPIPMPASKRPIIMVCTFVAVALEIKSY